VSQKWGKNSTDEVNKENGDDENMDSSQPKRTMKPLMDCTALASTPEQQWDREAMEEQMRTRKLLVHAAINEAIDRKNDLLQEF